MTTTVRRFRKNPHLPVVIVPGHGRVHDVDILEGDQYQHYAPHLLHEIGAVEVKPTFQSVPAAAAVPALHDALTIAARETVPVEEPMPLTADPAPPATEEVLAVSGVPEAPAAEAPPKRVHNWAGPKREKHATMGDAIPEQMSTPNALAVFLPTEPAPPAPPTPTQPESNSANDAPNATLGEEAPPLSVKNKGGRPRKVKPAPDA